MTSVPWGIIISGLCLLGNTLLMAIYYDKIVKSRNINRLRFLDYNDRLEKIYYTLRELSQNKISVDTAKERIDKYFHELESTRVISQREYCIYKFEVYLILCALTNGVKR